MIGSDFATTRVISYDYDDLYRLTEADYSTGEVYTYTYDPVGNRRSQMTLTATTVYTYDQANRLVNVNGIGYTWDNNGNLRNTGVSTHTFDTANRLTETIRAATTLQPIYNGLGDRVGQTIDASTTDFALDVQGLPEVIYTSDGNAYPSATLRASLHLPGLIMADSPSQGQRYLLADGLGSVRQAVDSQSEVAVYHEFDPYGGPILIEARICLTSALS